jgi:putative membrane protein
VTQPPFAGTATGGWTPAGVRRNTHPITPLIAAGRVLPVAFFAAIALGPDVGAGLLLLLAGIVLLVLVAAGVSYLSWQRFSFWFDESGDLRIDKGVLTRTETRLQLSRLQSVDVVQPLLARLAGLAEVRVEVAGAGESRAAIQFLTLSDAQALRAEVLGRAAGVHPEAGEAPEQVLHVVPAPLLIKSLIMRGATFALLVISVVIVVTTVLTEGTAGLALLITGGIPILTVFAEFTRFFDFTVAESPDGLRTRGGLLQTRSQTVPPGRVHAVAIVEPFLWRRFGWVRVVVTLAASPDGDQGDGQTQGVLLPVGTRAEAELLLSRLLPGFEVDQVPWVGVPANAVYRAPFQHRRLGVALTPEGFCTRSGWLTWRTSWVPNARTQSMTLVQGPWQRRLGLATVRVDIVGGPVNVLGLHRDATDARWLVDRQAERSGAARAEDRPARWMRPAAGSGTLEAPGSPVQDPPPDTT